MEEKETIHVQMLTELTGNLFSEESEWEEDWSESDEYGMPLDGTELADYEEVIREELERYGEDDLMQYFDGSESIQGKIQSAVVTIENKDGILYGCTKLELNEFLSQEELQEFTEYITGQYSDGHKYHSNAKSYYTEIRKISDDLCRKYGLSIIESNQKKSIPYVQWKAEQEGKPTWRTAIRLDIRESVQESYSWSQFLKEMEKRGYTWKLNRKYISLKAPGMERYIRLRSLGKNYSEEEIRGQILQPKVKRVYQKAVQIHPKKKLTGIQALYYFYLYQMGVLPKRPKRSPYAVREDIRKLDRRIEQIEFLMKHDIITREQLAAYREPLQKQIA